MEIVTTIEDAEKWFLEHSGGSVIVENARGYELECDNFPLAEAWLLSGEEDFS